MGIFPCPCCTYVTCVDLILPWCDPPTANFCRWAAHLGTPCGLPEHSQVRGTCICQLDPTSMGRSEPQDSLCFSGDQTWNRPPWLTAFCAPWETFLILPACHFHAASNLLQEACPHFLLQYNTQKMFHHPHAPVYMSLSIPTATPGRTEHSWL